MNTKNTSLLFLLLMTWSFSVLAKSTNEKESDAIDKQVWQPFMQAFATNDGDLMNSVHTDDVIRVSIDNDHMMLGEQYKTKTSEVFGKWKASGRKQTLLLSIHSRVIKDDVAFDTGIFKQTQEKNGKSSSAYGNFFVILKKVEGKWKILSDADTGRFEQKEEAFQKGRIIAPAV